MKRNALVTLALSAVMLLSACSTTSGPAGQNQQAAQKKTYKIGVMTPLSGPAAALGNQLQKVMESRLKELNAKNDYQIELAYEDTKCDAAAAKAAYDKLTSVDGIKFLIGGVCSSETLAFVDSLTGDGVFAISVSNSNPALENKSKNYFTLSYSDALTGEAMADELGKFKKVALITEQNDYNIGIQKVVEDTLKNKYPNTQIVADEMFPKASTDFRSTLDKIKAAAPEALLLNPNAGVTSEALLKQLGETKLTTQLIGQFAYTSSNVLASAPGVAKGMIIVDAPGVSSPDFQATFDKLVKENGTMDDLGKYYAAATIDALDLASSEIAKNDGDVAGVVNDLRSGSFDLNVGKVSFGDKSFASGIGVAKYLVENDKAVAQ